MGNIVLKLLKEQKISLFFWSVGIFALTAIQLSVYPSIKESSQDLQAYIENMPDAFKALIGELDYASPVGFLSSELFSFMMPMILIIFAVLAGSGAIAGEEEKGTLDVLLANPIPRWKVVTEKFITMILTTTILSSVMMILLITLSPTVDMQLDSRRVVEMLVSLELLAIFFGSFALFLGSATGSRAISSGVTGVVAIGGFIINIFYPMVKIFEDIRFASPFYHYIGENPLVVGLKMSHVSVLLGSILVFFILSLITFQRRDLKI